MKISFQVVVIALLLSVSINIYAAKEVSKDKKGVVLKFTGFDLRSFNNLNLFSRTAFQLRTNLNTTTTDKAPQTASVNSFMTVQRGNVTYIYPYKYKVSKAPLFKVPAAPKL